jgi:hypothetical protein
VNRELSLLTFKALLASSDVKLSEREVMDLHEAFAFVENMTASVRLRGQREVSTVGGPCA